MKSSMFLSYFLSESTPGYGGATGFKSEVVKDMCCGDSCNQQNWTISNHIGTHIDCPKHFDANGKTLSDFDSSFWIMNRIKMLSIEIKDSLLIDIEPYLDLIPKDCEFLILKTGFCYKRSEQIYWEKGPGITAISGKLLRSKRPNIKIIGFDFISLTSYQHRPEGRLAHKSFLHSDGPNDPILIIEDMDLTNLNTEPDRVTIAPLLVQNADGAQVTVFAEFN